MLTKNIIKMTKFLHKFLILNTLGAKYPITYMKIYTNEHTHMNKNTNDIFTKATQCQWNMLREMETADIGTGKNFNR
jgi:hypothetical protein